MLFRIKHIPNMLVRVFTRDKYYICEECHKLHKRDGKEIRLDEPIEHLMVNPIWYGSVGLACFIRQQKRVRKILREALLKDLTED